MTSSVEAPAKERQRTRQSRESGDARLGHEDRIRLALLALPTFALALAITIVST